MAVDQVTDQPAGSQPAGQQVGEGGATSSPPSPADVDTVESVDSPASVDSPESVDSPDDPPPTDGGLSLEDPDLTAKLQRALDELEPDESVRAEPEPTDDELDDVGVDRDELDELTGPDEDADTDDFEPDRPSWLDRHWYRGSKP